MHVPGGPAPFAAQLLATAKRSVAPKPAHYGERPPPKLADIHAGGNSHGVSNTKQTEQLPHTSNPETQRTVARREAPRALEVIPRPGTYLDIRV